jgi:hypothetical protein
MGMKSWPNYLLVCVVIGVLILILGHVISYYLMPIPHLVFGPLLAIAAFILAWKYPQRWVLALAGVSLPFLLASLYSIPQLITYAEEANMSISLIDYMIMLSPLGLALVGGIVGQVTANR